MVCWIAPPDDGEAPGRSRSDVMLCVNAVSRAPRVAVESSRRRASAASSSARIEVAVELALALGDEPVGARLVALGLGRVLGTLRGCGRVVGAVALPDGDDARDERDDEQAGRHR